MAGKPTNRNHAQSARALGFATFQYQNGPVSNRAVVVLQWPRNGSWQDQAQFALVGDGIQAHKRAPFGRLIVRDILPDGARVETIIGLPTGPVPAIGPMTTVEPAPVSGFDSKPDFVITKSCKIIEPSNNGKAYRVADGARQVSEAHGNPVNFTMVQVNGTDYFLAFDRAFAVGIAQALTRSGRPAKLAPFVPSVAQAFDDKRQAVADKAKLAAANWKKAIAGEHFNGKLPDRQRADKTIEPGDVCHCPACQIAENELGKAMGAALANVVIASPLTWNGDNDD